MVPFFAGARIVIFTNSKQLNQNVIKKSCHLRRGVTSCSFPISYQDKLPDVSVPFFNVTRCDETKWIGVK